MSFLCVIVDCNWNWGSFLEKNNGVNNLETFRSILSSIVAFSNAHLLSSLNNHLLVLAGGVKGNGKKLFSSDSLGGAISGPIETIEAKLREALLHNAESDGNEGSSCYAGAVSLAICAFQRYSKEVLEPTGRIVIINLTTDLSAEQNMLMNLFFSANQHSIVVDVAFLGEPAPILQQACDITNGTHMLIEKPEQLIQHLMKNCLGNSLECRDAFAVRNDADVDYRATCHCHNKLVDVGWVCSVCLSVHCQFLPFCTTCNVIFALSAGQKRTRKRKKDE